MRNGKIFSSIRNFLAIWAGILVAIFLAIEAYKMIETFIANASFAFEVATEAWVVLGAMLVSLIVNLIISAIQQRKKN